MKIWRYLKFIFRKRKVAPPHETFQESEALSVDVTSSPAREDTQAERSWWRWLLPCCRCPSTDVSTPTEEASQRPVPSTPTSTPEERKMLMNNPHTHSTHSTHNTHSTHSTHNPHNTHNTYNLHNPHNTHNTYNLHNSRNLHNTHNTHNTHNSHNLQNSHNTHNLHNSHNTHNTHNSHNLHNLHNPHKPHNSHNLHNPHKPHNSHNLHKHYNIYNPYTTQNLHNDANIKSSAGNLPSQEQRSTRSFISEVTPDKRAILKNIANNPHLAQEEDQINSAFKKVTFKEERASRSFRPFMAEEYEMPRNGRPTRQVDKKPPEEDKLETIVQEHGASEAKPAHAHSSVPSFGFPNIGQTCYMNSSLQSLLALTDFMNDISLTEKDWGNFPGAKMLKVLLRLRNSHASRDLDTKIKLLLSFKMAVVMNAPDFMGNLQHDAHEFLTTVLNQVSMIMSAAAEQNIQPIVCPVKKHMQFYVNDVRKCKRCNARTVRKLQYTNLSLDVIPRATVEEMIQRYFTEEDVVFRCEWCEGSRSVLSSSLESLPRVFILQLKRFLTGEKRTDPVRLQRDILVRSAQGAACYSLVSVINHLGTLNGGHYVCDCIYPDRSPDDLSDPWMILNDATVILTNGAEICEQRSSLGYILFYKRNDVDISAYE